MNALIEQCRRLGVRLRAEGEALAYDAPKGAMTSELAAALKAHKPAILAALATPAVIAPVAAYADPALSTATTAPLSPASASRRQKVLAIRARDGHRLRRSGRGPEHRSGGHGVVHP
jgi:TubC N-terminal docking domain